MREASPLQSVPQDRYIDTDFKWSSNSQAIRNINQRMKTFYSCEQTLVEIYFKTAGEWATSSLFCLFRMQKMRLKWTRVDLVDESGITWLLMNNRTPQELLSQALLLQRDFTIANTFLYSVLHQDFPITCVFLRRVVTATKKLTLIWNLKKKTR